MMQERIERIEWKKKRVKKKIKATDQLYPFTHTVCKYADL